MTKVIITEVRLRVDRAAWSNTCCLDDCRVRTDCVGNQSGTKHGARGALGHLSIASNGLRKEKGAGLLSFHPLRWREAGAGNITESDKKK